MLGYTSWWFFCSFLFCLIFTRSLCWWLTSPSPSSVLIFVVVAVYRTSRRNCGEILGKNNVFACVCLSENVKIFLLLCMMKWISPKIFVCQHVKFFVCLYLNFFYPLFVFDFIILYFSWIISPPRNLFTSNKRTLLLLLVYVYTTPSMKISSMCVPPLRRRRWRFKYWFDGFLNFLVVIWWRLNFEHFFCVCFRCEYIEMAYFLT